MNQWSKFEGETLPLWTDICADTDGYALKEVVLILAFDFFFKSQLIDLNP